MVQAFVNVVNDKYRILARLFVHLFVSLLVFLFVVLLGLALVVTETSPSVFCTPGVEFMSPRKSRRGQRAKVEAVEIVFTVCFEISAQVVDRLVEENELVGGEFTDLFFQFCGIDDITFCPWR